ncbi:MAG: amidinotransferase [Flavobacteriales bacterium]|nr:amidinotransferase [Flavobacteriales bacterium]
MCEWAHEHMPAPASSVILVRPTGFGFDPLTAPTNAFQRDLHDPELLPRVFEEFDGLLEALDRCGIDVIVLDPVDPAAPNAVFPNNWFSTHADGTVVLYPMCSPSRRSERDRAMDVRLEREGFVVRRLIDLSALERDERFLEGTGSLVIDHERNIAYAALSPRTSERALNVWCGALHGDQVPFLATMDGTLAGQPIYHTNVLMALGERFAVVCLDAMPYPVDRDDVNAELERSGRTVIPITLDQMQRFVGNMLQLRRRRDARSFIFLSETAYRTLMPSQRIALEAHGQLVPVAIPTIEQVGGGSVRCMLAENFLEARGS